MPDKASLPITIAVGTKNSNGTSYSATYSGTGSSSGPGVTAPSVTETGDITVYEDTNVTFSLDTAGFTFPNSGTLITIGGTAYSAGSNPSDSSFSIGSDQPTNASKDLELEDNDADGTSSGVQHEYNLHVENGGTGYTLDPNFYNRN